MLFAFAGFQQLDAQSDKIQRFNNNGIFSTNTKVNGTCDMDRHRIEKAAYSIEGVKSAVWDQGSKILTLRYDMFKKDAADKVQKKIALFGNDTEKYVADDAAYKALPDCCHYKG